MQRAAVAVLVLLLAGLSFTPLAALEQSPLQKFMRKKLDSSGLVLEGLSLEDYGLIRKGAQELLEMSKSELWNALTDEDYRNFNREFRSTIRKLEQAAEKEDLDNALLQWTDATKSCVECHRYVRQQRPVLK